MKSIGADLSSLLSLLGKLPTSYLLDVHKRAGNIIHEFGIEKITYAKAQDAIFILKGELNERLSNAETVKGYRSNRT